jgi:hypothetical protein
MLEKSDLAAWIGFSGSGKDKMATSHNSKPDFAKDWEFLDQLSDYHLSSKDYAQWNY